MMYVDCDSFVSKNNIMKRYSLATLLKKNIHGMVTLGAAIKVLIFKVKKARRFFHISDINKFRLLKRASNSIS